MKKRVTLLFWGVQEAAGERQGRLQKKQQKRIFRYRESNPRRLGENQTCYLLHHSGAKKEEGENRTREPEGLGPEPSAFDRFATSPHMKQKKVSKQEPSLPF